MIDSICVDPTTDNITKVAINRPPIVIRFYHELPFKIFYRFHSANGVDILSIRRAEPVPPLADWDDWLKR